MQCVKPFPALWILDFAGKIQWVWPSFSFADCKWIGIFSNLLKFAEKHQTWEIQRWMLWWESHNTSWTKRVQWRMRHILQSLSKQAEHATRFVDWSLYVRRVYNRCSKKKFDLFHEHFIVEWWISQPDFYSSLKLVEGKSMQSVLRINFWTVQPVVRSSVLGDGSFSLVIRIIWHFAFPFIT